MRWASPVVGDGAMGCRMGEGLARCCRRQADGEPRALAGGRLEVDGPAVVADDPVAHGQSQPRPLADRLGGEERVEDLLADRRVDPGAGVGYLDLGPGAGRAGANDDLPPRGT